MQLYKPTEAQIQASILDYLARANRGVLWRNNTGGAYTKTGFISFGKKGSGDIIGCYRGYFVSIEVKSASGHLSDEQVDFARQVTENGGYAIVARSIDDVVELFRRIDSRVSNLETTTPV